MHFYDNIIFPKDIGEVDAILKIKEEIKLRRKKGAKMMYGGILEKDNYYRAVCIREKKQNHVNNIHNILNQYANSQGIQIINIAPKGFDSSIYKKITWEKVVNDILSN